MITSRTTFAELQKEDSFRLGITNGLIEHGELIKNIDSSDIVVRINDRITRNYPNIDNEYILDESYFPEINQESTYPLIVFIILKFIKELVDSWDCSFQMRDDGRIIKIDNIRLIDLRKIRTVDQLGKFIYFNYSDSDTYQMAISFSTEKEAKFVFEKIYESGWRRQ